eukprot:TRINITY_DN1636_c0_g1::TRINITY_DN1636_c0_g1_i1::g.17733::m.17733 TRINITY_DN1636_c0_g1::TRINITY_DN1636_c0_g1_i1::g.17733  ORF type:complete len:322 (+),score=18.98,sp/Q08DK7/MCATL_BOVIN/38.46/3e-59,sp/Q08DK7/MCATL_BOVIN/31.61/3e-17,sp/Q08DK7/MCATL_BOVIN/41.56/3e-07,Mito_carr/PF00153.22/2.1e-19,Mito_carr/PF00153.22/4.4e-25,Mito_carr/PF00153.22/2.7e-25 TRINITY_DN1636_c0_g1_i1:103-1068(+)
MEGATTTIELNAIHVGIADSFAGAIASTAGIITGQPLDTVRCRLQAQTTLTYKGPVDCLLKTVRKEGFLALFKGAGPPTVGAAGINAILFSTFGQMERVLRGGEDAPPLAPFQLFLAGSVAGLASSVVVCPVELVKLRLQMQGSSLCPNQQHYRGMIHCARTIFQQNGIRGLYQGYTSTAIRETPACGIYMSSYEMLKQAFQQRRLANEGIAPSHPDSASADLLPSEILIAGGLAGAFSWVPVYPFDVIKTRLQISEPGKYRGVLHCFQDSVKSYGWRVLFRGLGTTIVRGFPANAVIFFVYEHTSEMFKNCITALHARGY